MAEPYYETKDGYEIQFGTNHMGHFLLTKLLLPAVSLAAETADPGSVRIVNLSSIGHMASVNGINLKDIHAQLACGHTLQRYSLSKLANMQHARALAKRYPKIVCVSAHPGVVDTGLYVWFIGGYKVMSVAIWVMHRVFGTLPEMGALNQLCCAVGPSVGLEDSGEYFVPVGRAVNKVGWWWERGTWATRWGSNEKASDELWEWSEKEVENHGY